MKKAIGITLLISFAAILVFGAINRTQAMGSGNEDRNRSNEISTGSQIPESSREVGSPQTGQGSPDRQGGPTTYGYGNRGEVRETQENSPSPQAQVDEWVILEGSVSIADNTLATITLLDGETLEITGRPWSFALENGYSLQTGDQVKLTGFYEDDGRFEVGSIENLTQGDSLQIRDQDGRPLWAGQGRRG